MASQTLAWRELPWLFIVLVVGAIFFMIVFTIINILKP